MLDDVRHVWTLGDGGDECLGLTCNEDGLRLGRTPLLEKRNGALEPRAQVDIERILACAFGAALSLDNAMRGLHAVATALNTKDLCRARIAAVQLRIPDLPDVYARLEMELEDIVVRLAANAKALAAGDWDPDKHPRAGTAPNPGWFAPTGGGGENLNPILVSDDDTDSTRLHLPPGERNDEIGDLLEWIANAKPEDAKPSAERSIACSIRPMISGTEQCSTMRLLKSFGIRTRRRAKAF
jgi:hypothetical protein